MVEYDSRGLRISRNVSVRPEDERSIALLKEWLSPAQAACLTDGYFCVEGSASGKKYRISARDGIFNIHDEDNNAYCFAPRWGEAPWGDVLLAQKIALECDEENVLKVANVRGHEAPWSFVANSDQTQRDGVTLSRFTIDELVQAIDRSAPELLLESEPRDVNLWPHTG